MIAAGKGELLVAKRPVKHHKSHEYIPCYICYGFFLANRMSTHIAQCPLKPEGLKSAKQAIDSGMVLLAPYINSHADESVVLEGMRETETAGKCDYCIRS